MEKKILAFLRDVIVDELWFRWEFTAREIFEMFQLWEAKQGNIIKTTPSAFFPNFNAVTNDVAWKSTIRGELGYRFKGVENLCSRLKERGASENQDRD